MSVERFRDILGLAAYLFAFLAMAFLYLHNTVGALMCGAFSTMVFLLHEAVDEVR